MKARKINIEPWDVESQEHNAAGRNYFIDDNGDKFIFNDDMKPLYVDKPGGPEAGTKAYPVMKTEPFPILREIATAAIGTDPVGGLELMERQELARRILAAEGNELLLDTAKEWPRIKKHFETGAKFDPEKIPKNLMQHVITLLNRVLIESEDVEVEAKKPVDKL